MKKTWYTPTGEKKSAYVDALNQPHLLIAGATGSGKSVIVNGLIYTALYSAPCQVQFILIDPKRVELSMYRDLPHTIRYASEPENMVSALNEAMRITEDRYAEMQKEGIRKYNGSQVYVIIDELADLMTTNKRQVQPLLQRLCQIGRAAGVHVIACTQCPLREVIPTAIKVNFDARFGLRTRSAQDSRNILGVTGCEILPKYGQAYYMTPAEFTLYKIPFYDDDVLKERVNHWMRQNKRGLLARLFKTA